MNYNIDESKVKRLNLFADYAADNQKKAEEEAKFECKKCMQRSMLDIKKEFGEMLF